MAEMNLILTNYGQRWVQVPSPEHESPQKEEALRVYEEIVVDLKVSGLTHIQFSVDGPEHVHDRWRRHPGLYRRIVDGIAQVKNAGIEPRISFVVRHTDIPADYARTLEELSGQIYGVDTEAFLVKRLISRSDPSHTVDFNITQIQRLVDDPTNTLSNFVDINNGVSLRQYKFSLSDVAPEDLRCRAFFRPRPSLRIMASGELAVCPILNAGEKYGNVHEQDLIYLLNHIQDSFVYRLHAENKIGAYLPLIDREIFGDYFEHVCTLKAIATLIAKKMYDQSISPDDRSAVKQVNLEVAEITGHKA